MHARLLHATSILTAALFAGCALGPNYRRPAVDSPASFRDQKGQPSTESLADLAWWKVFHDPALQSLIREGLKNNYDLRIAITRIEQARAQQIQTRSLFFPQLGYSAGAERARGPGQRIPASSTPPTVMELDAPGGATTLTIPGRNTPQTDVRGGTSNSFRVQGSFSWEIDVWGRIRRSNEASLARYLATEEARRGVIQSLVAEIARTYFQLLEMDAELGIAREAKVSFGQSLDLFTKQQTGGIASDLEVARATAAMASAAAAIPEIEQQIRTIENRLSFLLGRNPGPIKRGISLLSQKTPPRVPAGIPSDLLTRRPDIRGAEQQVVAANAEVGVAITNFLPMVDLTAAAGAVSPVLNEITTGKWTTWSLGGALNGPIFKGGLLVGQYKEAKARWEEAALTYNQTALNAFGEVSNALIARQKSAESRAERERQVAALRKSVQLATDRYTIGISTYYEILEAQQQLFPAEQALVQTRLDQLLSIVDLYRALGGGWSEVIKKEQVVPARTKKEKPPGKETSGR